MNKIAIIIPSRLDAQRFPNKPLKLINNKEMILHVYDQAIKSKVGEVYVATPDEKIIDTSSISFFTTPFVRVQQHFTPDLSYEGPYRR